MRPKRIRSKRSFFTNKKSDGTKIAPTVAEQADARMRNTMKNSGFKIVDERDRVTSVRTANKAYKSNLKDYTGLYDSAINNLKSKKI